MYNTILQGFFCVDRCVDAQELLNKMQKDGQKPSIYTHDMMLHGLMEIDDALWLLSVIENNEQHLCISWYNIIIIIIHGLCKHGKVDEGRGLFNSLFLD